MIGKPEEAFFNAALSHLNSITSPSAEIKSPIKKEGMWIIFFASYQDENYISCINFIISNYQGSNYFSEVLMIGDDIRDDVIGAQDAGFQVNN